MTTNTDPSWAIANQNYLLSAIAQVHAYLQQQPVPSVEPWPSNQSPSALDRLCQLFQLSPFERWVLLLCAGVEVNEAIAPLCAQLQGDAQKAYPTFRLALSRFPDAHWNALTPQAPLRQWQLIEVGGGPALTVSPLRIDERIVHELLGIPTLDHRLKGIVSPLSSLTTALPPSYQSIADRLTQAINQPQPALIQLCGSDSTSQRAIAASALSAIGLQGLCLSADTLPTDLGQMQMVETLWQREAILTGSALVLDCHQLGEQTEGAIVQLQAAIDRVIEECPYPLIVLTRDRRRSRQRVFIQFDIQPPTTEEQYHLWQTALGHSAASLNGQLDRLVAHFNLSPLAIHSACTQITHTSSEPIFEHLWQACRTQARPRLSDLAQPMPTEASWEDLVLPEKEQQTLRTIAAQVRQRSQVYERWGFVGKGQRGLGISALFAGPSGTGKTLAADVLARELNLDLYRIDLSSVVSKYIGETEKNLRRIFDAAEAGGVILLFDEADALFGKRSEVKDSHDRYANMEVAYLLQRMEAYRGLAILTTNLKGSLDQAFLRRLRFIVQFPFPDATQRTEIWQRIFPRQTPTQDLAYHKLARLNVSGGNIRNIALNAAFLAADADEPVMMKHVLKAAQSEYTKLERPLTDAEIKGWI